MIKMIDVIIFIGLMFIALLLLYNCEVKSAKADDCDDAFQASIEEECAKSYFNCKPLDEGK